LLFLRMSARIILINPVLNIPLPCTRLYVLESILFYSTERCRIRDIREMWRTALRDHEERFADFALQGLALGNCVSLSQLLLLIVKGLNVIQPW
jgi:hypothetical protein